MEEMKYKISEIFLSIDGEGPHAGGLSVFIRFYGCNLKCSYCDSGYACNGGAYHELSLAELSDTVSRYNCRHITITGGEPLMQRGIDSVVSHLLKNGYEVDIETNGSIDPCGIPDEASILADMKSPSSGQEPRNRTSIIGKLRPGKDILKLVLSKEDFGWAEDLLRRHPPECLVYLSPIFGKLRPSELVEFAMHLANCFPEMAQRLRVQLQLHKIIWPGILKGV